MRIISIINFYLLLTLPLLLTLLIFQELIGHTQGILWYSIAVVFPLMGLSPMYKDKLVPLSHIWSDLFE